MKTPNPPPLGDEVDGLVHRLRFEKPLRDVREELVAVLAPYPVPDRIAGDGANAGGERGQPYRETVLRRQDASQNHRGLAWEDEAKKDRSLEGGEEEDQSQRRDGRKT